jgi:isocitrate dehydrogenase (NAD+)
MLLRHIGRGAAADRLAKAIAECESEGKVVVTGDRDGATCKEYAAYVLSKL